MSKWKRMRLSATSTSPDGEERIYRVGALITTDQLPEQAGHLTFGLSLEIAGMMIRECRLFGHSISPLRGQIEPYDFGRYRDAQIPFPGHDQEVEPVPAPEDDAPH